MNRRRLLGWRSTSSGLTLRRPMGGPRPADPHLRHFGVGRGGAVRRRNRGRQEGHPEFAITQVISVFVPVYIFSSPRRPARGDPRRRGARARGAQATPLRPAEYGWGSPHVWGRSSPLAFNVLVLMVCLAVAERRHDRDRGRSPPGTTSAGAAVRCRRSPHRRDRVCHGTGRSRSSSRLPVALLMLCGFFLSLVPGV
jgi:hypothetical protein